jgi:hypothetical protein
VEQSFLIYPEGLGMSCPGVGPGKKSLASKAISRVVLTELKTQVA